MSNPDEFVVNGLRSHDFNVKLKTLRFNSWRILLFLAILTLDLNESFSELHKAWEMLVKMNCA